MYLIAGLGNPGKAYAKNRHNVGFMVIERLAKDLGVSSFKEKHQALLAETKIGEHKVILAEPQTFMNLSGQAVREIMAWHKIAPTNLIVISDDVDLELGKIRLRPKGSSGGHKGLDSVMAHLKSNEFARIRLGIGRGQIETAEYVLGNFDDKELPLIDEAIVKAAAAANEIIMSGMAAAMNRYNQ